MSTLVNYISELVTNSLLIVRLQIERIQNPGLYRQYMNCKNEMDRKNGHSPPNERRLWHGTAPTNISNINERNFNRSYGGVHGTYIFESGLSVWKKTMIV